MSRFDSAAPTFPVADVGATARWYEAELGFTIDAFPDEEPWSFAMVVRDGVELMLQRVDGYRKPDLRRLRPEGQWDAYIRMAGLDELFETVRDRVEALTPPTRRPYGETELEVRDPNGYVLVFAEGRA